MDRRMAVSEFLTATCAPAITRPELSLTLPEIVPPATCARQPLPVTSTIAVTHATVKEIETKGARVGISTFFLYGFASLYASHYPGGNILCGHEIAPNAIYVHSGIPQAEGSLPFATNVGVS